MLGPQIDWQRAALPSREPLCGSHVVLRPVEGSDAEALFAVSKDAAIWTYLPYGPYSSVDELRARLAEIEASADPLFYAIIRDGMPEGIASYLRIKPDHGSIEIGHIWFGTPLQRTTAATEAIFLLARHAFDELGYRRLEWKCNALNVVKGRNRDTAWYAITDEEWPAIRAAFESWLAPSNFDGQGRQRAALAAPR